MAPIDDPGPVPALIARMRGYGTTIFAQMTALATQTGAINLGQGFPDEDGPPEVLEAAVDAIRAGRNQYPPGRGVPELRAAIADHQRHWYGLELDPETEVLVTVGATEALAATVLALCEPGDEVVMFEPYFDSYAAVTSLAGAVRRTVPLRFPEYAVEEDRLRAAFSARTRLVLLNTPHNPTGKVFTAEEIELVCSIAREFGAWVVTDEVYEHLTFEDAVHIPAATLPGMAEHVITIGSAGKTLSTTGWKVGWVTGPAQVVTAVTTVKQFLTYVGSGPFQPAVAVGLRLPDERYRAFASTLQHKRNVLTAGLRAAGMTVNHPLGTYFVIADTAALGVRDAVAFCQELPHRVGVVGVPASVFHDDPAGCGATTQVRFAFCKRQDVLEEAAARLADLGPA